jgi:hypothetical protein
LSTQPRPAGPSAGRGAWHLIQFIFSYSGPHGSSFIVIRLHRG